MSKTCPRTAGHGGVPAAVPAMPAFALSAATLLVLGAIACLQPARADDATDPGSAADAAATQLAPVTVIGTPGRNPDASVSPGEIAPRRAATSDTAELLSGLPGAAVQAAGGVSGLPVLDGMADDRLNVRVDGVSTAEACANHMNPPLSYIAPSRVQRIDVYSGIAPVSLGGDSIGGAVVVTSAPPLFAADPEHPLASGELGAWYRSNGRARGAELKADWASQDWAVGYAANVAKAEDYHAGGDFHPAGLAFAPNASVPGQTIPWIAADQVGSTAYLTRNQALTLATRRDGQQLVLRVDVQRIPEQLFPNQRMDMTANDSTLADLNYRGRFGWGLLEATVYDHEIRHAMNFGTDKQFYYGSSATPTSVLATGMPMNTRASVRGGDLHGRLPLSDDSDLTVGTELQNLSYDDWWPPSPSVLPAGVTMAGMAPNTFWNIHGGQRDRFDLYGEVETRWTPAWQTLVGVRVDRVRMDTGDVQGYNNGPMYNGAPLYPASTFNAANHAVTDRNLDVSAQARYTPDASTTLTFGYAQKTRSPNLFERYAWSTSGMAMEMVGWAGDGNSVIGNLNLRPEIARTLSATLERRGAEGAWNVRATPYVSYIQNAIGVRRCPTSVCGSSAAVVSSLSATQGFVDLQFVNTTARIAGIDLSGRAELGRVAGWGTFSGSAVVSWVRGVDLGQHDNLYDMMPLNATVAVEQRLGAWTHRIEEVMVAAKSEVSGIRNEVPTAGYALLNLRSRYASGPWRVDLGIDNVLDRFYNLPLGGAYLGQGATMSGSAIPWGVPVPGMGRSVYAGVTRVF